MERFRPCLRPLEIGTSGAVLNEDATPSATQLNGTDLSEFERVVRAGLGIEGRALRAVSVRPIDRTMFSDGKSVRAGRSSAEW